MPNSELSQLYDVLAQEKAALITADFEPLAHLIARKETLLAELSVAPPTATSLQSVRDKMDENQALLAAAIKGVAAAGERLEALQDVQSGLRVYDPDGAVELTPSNGRTLEKKA